MAELSSKQQLVDQVDRVSDLVAKAKKGDAFALDDALKELTKLRRALTLTTSDAARPFASPRIPSCHRDAVALYKWGQSQLAGRATLDEIHDFLQHKGSFPGELKKLHLAKRENFKQYVRAGLAREGTSHRKRRTGGTGPEKSV